MRRLCGKSRGGGRGGEMLMDGGGWDGVELEIVMDGMLFVMVHFVGGDLTLILQHGWNVQ